MFIGPIIAKNKQLGEISGTGVLISPNLVLTAAHNIFVRNNMTINKNIMFYPGAYGKLENGYEVEDAFFPGKYAIFGE